MAKLSVYQPPIGKNGKPYWVPIVIKNRDTLVGYLEGVFVLSTNYDIPISESFDLLSSERFNDIGKNGKRIGLMSKDEKFNYYKDIVKDAHTVIKHKEQDREDILNDYEFGISCTCGNFYGFEMIRDISEEDLVCQMCDNVIINYTHREDDEYKFDGKTPNHDEIGKMLEEIHQELGLFGDDIDDSL